MVITIYYAVVDVVPQLLGMQSPTTKVRATSPKC